MRDSIQRTVDGGGCNGVYDACRKTLDKKFDIGLFF